MSKPKNDRACRKMESWWRCLNEECPITLELLSMLPYPPFSLTSGGITSYFDGLALASYIVSRGIFQNPLTREDLTMADCRRLDGNLEMYCYNNHQHEPLPSSRKISVAEAFALRSNIHVDRADRNSSRAYALQSTATAALAGLFVYGNDRPRGRHNTLQDEESVPMPATLQRKDQLVLDWGFDLTRTVDDSSARFAQEGWTVIDDDESEVVASQREAYQATQNAFPRLPGGESVGHAAAFCSNGTAIDEHFMERVRGLSLQEEQDRAHRQRQLELARQKLLAEALERREERKRMLQQQRAIGVAQWKKQKQEQEEIDRARSEIDQWREEQWNKLRVVLEAQRKETTERKNDVKAVNGNKQSDVEAPRGPSPDEIAKQKKAKTAVKRKRVRQRKKAQKAEERAEQEKLDRQKELEAQKAASQLQCKACGQGILGCGFEKYGKRVCSPKCARTVQQTC